MKLEGAHVLVTGASRGIGLEVARRMAERGARVSLVARESEALRNAANEVGGTAVPADLSDFDQVVGVVPRASEANGPVDVLAPAELARAVSGPMADRGSGAIVNVSSLAGETALRNIAAYGSSKAGLGYLTRTMQRELHPKTALTDLLLKGMPKSL